MKYKIGDKIVCLQNITNILNMTLFIKDNIYEILDVSNDTDDNCDYTINHILHGNEYGDFSSEFVNIYFKTLKQLRKDKLEKINDKFRFQNS
jgi:hypothetical protein